MRILYFTRDYTPHDHRFARSLSEHGIDVFYMRLERGPRQLEDRPLPAEVRQVVWHGGRSRFRWRDLPAYLVDLKANIRRIKPDILHAGPLQTCALLAALSSFRPLVSMSWGSDLLRDSDLNSWYRWATRTALRQSAVMVGDCQAVRDKAVSFGFPDDRIFTFPWGIDLERFKPDRNDPDALALRERLGWQSNFVVLSLRSWEPVYGIDVTLRGFARALQENPKLRLLLMGGGSQASLVHQLIQQFDLADKVYLGGQVNQNDLPKIYHAADLYVSASHSDGSSVSLMEALGCGLPVLLSDIPSNREWIESGVQGWFFPDGDDITLTAHLTRLASRGEDLGLIAQASRRVAENRADWNKNFKVLCRAYDAAIELSSGHTSSLKE